MDDLLKEAIADAKAVRETALANAKMALEEAFTPRLKSMLAKKIQHEIEEEDEVSDEDTVSEDGVYEEEDPFAKLEDANFNFTRRKNDEPKFWSWFKKFFV